MNVQLIIFDLDNTLYPADNGVFDQMDKKMTTYVANATGLDQKEANSLRIRYWKEYGTTLRGLMLHHDIDPEDFLVYVHDINIDGSIQKHPELNQILERFSARKVIHTNGTKEHAENILSAMCIHGHFSDIYDIRLNAYIPKPDTSSLQKLLKLEKVRPEHTVVIDDMPENIKTAKLLGAHTILVNPEKSSIHADQHIQQICQIDIPLTATDS